LTPDERKKADEQQKVSGAEEQTPPWDELQAVVGRFNEQLKIFKAKQPPKP